MSPRTLQALFRQAAGRSPRVLLTPLRLDIAAGVRHIARNLVADMPDRIIGATALTPGLPLVTRDRAIQRLGIETIW